MLSVISDGLIYSKTVISGGGGSSTKNIIAFFTDNGTPKTGLSPQISIYEVTTSGSLIISSESMFEVGEGGYAYNFLTYNELSDYYIVVDGGAILSNPYDRYGFGINDSNSISDLELHLATTENVTQIRTDIQNTSGTLSSEINDLNSELISQALEINTNIRSTSGSLISEIQNLSTTLVEDISETEASIIEEIENFSGSVNTSINNLSEELNSKLDNLSGQILSTIEGFGGYGG